MKRLFISASLLAISLTASAQTPFISNAAYRTTMQQQLDKRIKTVGKTFYNTTTSTSLPTKPKPSSFFMPICPLPT